MTSSQDMSFGPPEDERLVPSHNPGWASFDDWAGGVTLEDRTGVLTVPHETLSKRADAMNKPVHPEFIQRMKDTMVLFKAQGIAAPQLGMSKRIIMIRRDDDSFLLLVNPRITGYGDEWTRLHEACLSIPDRFGPVVRYDWVEVEYIGEDGNLYLTRFGGLEARTVQHEIDHLNGILLTDLW